MYKRNRTILIGTMINQKSSIVHAVKMGGREGHPLIDPVCGSILITSSYDFRNNDNSNFIANVEYASLIDWDSITCKSCKRILRDLLYNEEHYVHNLNLPKIDKPAVLNVPTNYTCQDSKYLKEVIEFSREHIRRQQNGGCCKWQEVKAGRAPTDRWPKNCTYRLTSDTLVCNCSWDRCEKIFDTLRCREDKQEFLTFINNGKIQEKEDDTCKKCYALDGHCKDCAPINGYKNFLEYSEEEDEGPCQECISSHVNADEFPCDDCCADNSWKYFEEKNMCKFFRGCPSSLANKKDCATDFQGLTCFDKGVPRNGLVELPFGIMKKTIYEYQDGTHVRNAPDFPTALRNARFSLIKSLFDEAQPKGFGVHSNDVQNILDNMCDDPAKWLERLTTILKPMSPEGEK